MEASLLSLACVMFTCAAHTSWRTHAQEHTQTAPCTPEAGIHVLSGADCCEERRTACVPGRLLSISRERCAPWSGHSRRREETGANADFLHVLSAYVKCRWRGCHRAVAHTYLRSHSCSSLSGGARADCWKCVCRPLAALQSRFVPALCILDH